MKYTLQGTTMPVVNVELDDGEEIYAEAGAMVWMSENMIMETFLRGGVMQGLGRMFTGESLFMTKFHSNGKGFVTFASSSPGKILDMEIKPGKEYVCQKDAFLAATMGVDMKVEFRKKLGVGLFGGEGFLLERIMGNGKAFIEIDGEVFEIELKAGERIKVDTGCIAMFEATAKYDIEMVKGVKNMIFGGEGLFLATLEGPGKVWLQSMPINSLAKKIAQYLPSK